MPSETREIIQQQFVRAQFDASTINVEAMTAEVVFATEQEVIMRNWEVGRFREVLVCDDAAGDLSRLNNGAPLLDTHNKWSISGVIGVVERAWFEKGKGRAIVRFSDREEVKPIWNDVVKGILRGISVGYVPTQYEVTEEIDKLPLYRAVKWEATELSLAPVQADPGSGVGRSQSNQETYRHTVQIINKSNKNTTMNRASASAILAMVRAAGLSADFAQTLIDDEAMTQELARTKIDEEKARVSPAAPAPADPIQTNPAPQPLAGDGNRASQILNAVRAAGFDLEYAQSLVDNKHMTIDAARAAIIEKLAASQTQQQQTNGNNPGVRVGTEEDQRFRNAATTGLILRSGALPGSAFKPEEITAGRSYQGTSLLRFSAQCLERSGVNTSTMSDMEIAGRALSSSTSDFPVILEAVLHRILLGAYSTVPDTWREFCYVGSVTDFRAHKRLRPGSLTKLDKVEEDGELKNKKLVDATSESITATTKGNIINVSRNMLINDDLGAFTRIAGDLGRAAARTIEVDVYALLASNPVMSDGNALFSSAHGNLAASGAAPSVATFDAMRSNMAKQKDHSNNEILDIRPSILLISVANGGEAKVINGSQYDPDANNKLQRMNKSYGIFSKIVETARITGNEYYGFADPSILPTLEVAFLNGVQAPYLEQEESFDSLGRKWRVYTDYGVGAIDWKGAYKNPGA